MSKARVFSHKPALVKIAAKPGGLTLTDAVRSANANLEGVRERSLSALEPSLDRMRVLARNAGTRLTSEDQTEIARLANGVIGVAGAFGYSQLSKAAYSLCELVDVFEESGGFDLQALIVHADGLKLLYMLRAPDQHAERETILSNLYRVVERMRRSSPNESPQPA